jgi:hypothetical protein
VGLLADFVVATPEDILQYGSLLRSGKPLPPDRFQRAEYKRLTPLALEMLWALLRGEKWDVKRHQLEHVFHTEDGETWLERFPDEFVRLLSLLDETAANQAADAWARSGEVRSNSSEIRPVLQDLRRLATDAQKSDRSLYLWGSL